MIYSYRLPFIGVTGTPVHQPPVIVDYMYRESCVRIKTRVGGTFDLTLAEFAALKTLLTASDSAKRVVAQLERYDRQAVLDLIEEVTHDSQLSCLVS